MPNILDTYRASTPGVEALYLAFAYKKKHNQGYKFITDDELRTIAILGDFLFNYFQA